MCLLKADPEPGRWGATLQMRAPPCTATGRWWEEGGVEGKAVARGQGAAVCTPALLPANQLSPGKSPHLRAVSSFCRVWIRPSGSWGRGAWSQLLPISEWGVHQLTATVVEASQRVTAGDGSASERRQLWGPGRDASGTFREPSSLPVRRPALLSPAH